MFSDPRSNLLQLDIQEGMIVVDLGAGSGFYSLEAARYTQSGRVYAVDTHKEILEKIKKTAATEHLRNVEIVWGNIEEIGGTRLKEASADRAIASNVLFQVEKPDDFCLEIKRILKSGGRVLVVDWAENTTLAPKTLVSKKMATAYFEKAGFLLDKDFDAGDHHYGLIFKKR